MRIGAFVKAVKSTKDTVRHYEEMDLLRPEWKGHLKEYNKKDIQDFQAIKDMQGLGLTLVEIQGIFETKREKGCGTEGLINSVIEKLTAQVEVLCEEESRIRKRRQETETLLKALKETAG